MKHNLYFKLKSKIDFNFIRHSISTHALNTRLDVFEM